MTAAVAANKTGWVRLLSISTGHLTGSTLALAQAWTHGSAPVPMFGAHSFGFYCAVQADLDADVPDDLLAVLTWAHEQGAEYVSFDVDGTWHGALPDHEATHGTAAPCPVDQPPPGCPALTAEDACRAGACTCARPPTPAP